ncbi:MAG: hypothetical protein KDJ37_11830 [Hyphomicrobiaceae bacterium]|nr:hypothetical protein [Hyphomicrobiaceae bacterium]
MVRSIGRVVFGFLLAMLAAGVTQVLFVLTPMEIVALPPTERAETLTTAAILALAAATHATIFSGLFALVAILIGEWLRQRSWVYYALIGMMIAAGGFIAQWTSENAAQPTIFNTYAMIAFATTGLVAGSVYWALAGRRAGHRREKGPPAPSDHRRRSEKRDDVVPADVTVVSDAKPATTTAATSVPSSGRAKSLNVSRQSAAGLVFVASRLLRRHLLPMRPMTYRPITLAV